MSDYPADLRYTKEHEWARIIEKPDEIGKVIRVGITQFAVEQLGDVTMVELPSEGDDFDKEQVFGTVESVKAVSDLFAPVAGKITRVNTPLDDSPEYVNEDPYDEGWMIEMQVTRVADLDELMTAEQYAAFVAEQD
jgi:glycine cleavage system H protein